MPGLADVPAVQRPGENDAVARRVEALYGLPDGLHFPFAALRPGAGEDGAPGGEYRRVLDEGRIGISRVRLQARQGEPARFEGGAVGPVLVEGLGEGGLTQGGGRQPL